jgi:ATP-dependent Lhr-like helicase
MADRHPALAGFSEPAAAWFTSTFARPTPPQAEGWPTIAAGGHTLVLAPTGTGKTLAAFFWGIDQLTRRPPPEDRSRRTRIVYLSPLRALAVDVEKNLRAPLQGIRLAAERLGARFHEPGVGLRTGDTPAGERRHLARHPPDLLITTPESLYLMLTSAARDTLRGVHTVIVDEIHAVAATKRGAHLALSLERLDRLCDTPPQRVGLSATQRPLEEIARFLGGYHHGTPRPVAIVDAGVHKALELEVVVPVEDLGRLGEVIGEPVAGPGPVRRSIWPAMHPRLLRLVEEHRSTIVFVNARRSAERLAARLNELALGDEPGGAEAVGTSAPAGREVVKAHHGSLSRQQRLVIEDELKRGELRGLVATSSLELGIDMGAVDLVVQVESPGAVSRGLQRVGRAGHQVGVPSRGKIFPKHRADLLEAAVVARRMIDGLIEETRYPRNPLDVLAQQIVAATAVEDWTVDDLAAMVRGAANFAGLGDEVLASVLEMLAGRYPSEDFAELRPRIVWDRVAGVVRARPGARRLAVTSGGTIPDRGLFGVFLPDSTRVGELDEEMVYESRVGETFLLGATTWRIQDITADRVVVVPAPGQPGKMPFWRGDGPGRPLELGRAVGAFTRRLRALPRTEALDLLRAEHCLDEWAALNLLGFLDHQAEATGVVPDDRTVVVERFRDEIGDWRVCILTPFGSQVHAPWAMALQHRLGEQWGLEVELMWSDDGIVLRLPEAVDRVPTDELAVDPDELDKLLVAQLPSTALFASRFRECSARALLLPRRSPDRRTPLWQQRQKAADLLAVAARYPSFPILLEATRECLNDVFDVPALRQVLAELRSRRIRMVAVDTGQASPMAQSLLFGWIAQYMYEGDAPLAERRAAALALDRDLLRELLGAEELRELLDPAVLADLEAELQRTAPGYRARSVDAVEDLLRWLGPLSAAEVAERSEGVDVAAALAQLQAERRAVAATVAGEERLAASDDAARLRDALGVALPAGLPAALTDPVTDPLGDLLTRYARTHGPFLAAEAAGRLGLAEPRVRPVLERLAAAGALVRGEFRPGGVEREWCHPEVLRVLRRRSLAALRREVEPVDAEVLARFLPAWQHVGGRLQGVDGVAEAVTALQGAALPASILEADVLAARVGGYQPADLDLLGTSGELVWVGAGALGSGDGRVRLVWRDQVAALAPPAHEAPDEPRHRALLDHLEARGAVFWPDLVRAAADGGQPYDDSSVLAALWDLVWAGLVTNDSLAPLRATVSGAVAGSRRRPGRGGAARRPDLRRMTRLGPPAGAGRWSLVGPLRRPEPTPTEIGAARAAQLLERYGVLTREMARAEGAEGGFAGLYPVLKVMEERGQVRRGYFVAGLGAAQFALPGAVDRLRHERDEPDGAPVVVLAAADPAQPYGAALAWPESGGRPSRAAGAFVVLRAGRPLMFVERGAKSLVTFPAAAGDPGWVDGLRSLVERGRLRTVEILKVDGRPTAEHPDVLAALLAGGFAPGYRGPVLRSPPGANRRL